MSTRSETLPLLPTIFIKRSVKQKQLLATADRVWDIEGYPSYFFDAQGRLFRFNARGEVIALKRAVKRYTVGLSTGYSS